MYKKLLFSRFLYVLRACCVVCIATVFSLNALADCTVNSVISQTPAAGTVYSVVTSNPVDGQSILDSNQMIASSSTYDPVNDPYGVLKASGSSYILLETSNVSTYNQQLYTYLQGSQWSVTFDTGTVTGYGVCGATKWGSENSTKTGALTSAGYGCSCTTDLVFDAASISAQKFLGLQTSGSSTSGTILDKNNYCRARCAALCANKVATDATFRNNLFNLYSTCPVVSSTTQYTITYDNNGGTGCDASVTYTGSTTICTPTRTGYVFDGWLETTNADVYDGGDTVSGTDLNLEAQWSQAYTITYIMDGGSGCTNTVYTNTATVCSDPTRQYYIFDGWATTENGEIEYLGDETITKTNLTLYAKWVYNACNNGYYRYNNSSCEPCESGYTSNGLTATSANDCYIEWTCPVSPTCPANSTNCAYTGATSGTDYYGAETTHCQTTYSCANGYTLTGLNPLENQSPSETGSGHGFINDSRNEISAETLYASTYGLTEDSTWASEFNYGVIRGRAACTSLTGSTLSSNATSSLDTGTECYCQVKDLKVGNNIQSISGAQWIYQSSESNATECAYFCASSCANDTEDDSSFRTKLFNSVPASNPQCSVIEYTITYNNMKDGEFPVAATIPATYTIESSALSIPNLTSASHTFLGWCDDEELTTNCALNRTIPAGSYGNKTFYAQWQYTITYNNNSGSGCSNTNYHGTTTLCTPTRTNYTFNGWATSDGGSVVYGGGDEITDTDLTLYAVWTLIPCSANEYMQNNTCSACPSHSTSAGGYVSECTCDTGYAMSSGSCALTTYTVTYEYNGGALANGISNPSTYTVETSNTVLNNPTKTDYFFGGWFKYSDFSGTAITALPGGLHENLTLYAKWTSAAECENCYCDQNGTALTTGAVTGLPTLSELLADGVYTDNGNGAWTPVDQDAYIEGQEWSVSFITGTVHGYAGCTATGWKTNQSYNALSSVNAGCACSLDKQHWWFTAAFSNAEVGSSDRATKTEYCRANCPARCASYFANNTNSLRSYMTNDYQEMHDDACPLTTASNSDTITLTWYTDDGVEYDSTTCTVGETIVLPEEPTRPGYNFAGWTVITNNNND